MDPMEFIHTRDGTYADTAATYYHVRLLIYDSDCSNISNAFRHGGNRLFHGSWINDFEFSRRTHELRIERVRVWERAELRPILDRCKSRPRYSIRQPVWSHRRRRSITSKSRQV